MVENHQTVVKTDVAIGQFQIVDGAARQFRLGEIFQIVTPVTEAAAQRKRQVNLVQQFKPRHQRVQNLPRVAELNVAAVVKRRNCPRIHVADGDDFAARAEGAESEKWICGDKRITRRRQIKRRGPQQNDVRARFHADFRRAIPACARWRFPESAGAFFRVTRNALGDDAWDGRRGVRNPE